MLKPSSTLTRNDIIELQRHCYKPLQDVTVLQGGVEQTLKVGSMISSSSYFDILEFAQAVEQAVIHKLQQQGLVAN